MEIRKLLRENFNIKSIATHVKYLTNAFDITSKDCLFIMIDIQEKFVGVIHEFDEVIKNADILNRSAELLHIPLIVTEHVPQKLGNTVRDLYIPNNTIMFDKKRFSVFNDDITHCVERLAKPVLVFYGIEAHICVVQSCLEAVKKGYHVLLVADAISSRKEYNKKIAIKMLVSKGVEVVTTEMLLFRLLIDADHERFRDISKLVK